MKIYKRNCDECGTPYTGQGKYFCSQKCLGKSRKGVKLKLTQEEIERRRETGRNNKGNKLSNETKRKIGEASRRMWGGDRGDILRKNMSKISSHPRSDEVKKKISDGNKGIKRPYLIERNKINPPMRGKHHTENAKKKIGEGVKGKKNGMYGKKPKFKISTIYTLKDGTQINMRSTWEAKFADYLDKNGLLWEYEGKTFELSGGQTYTPDFYINDWGMFIEIKGYPHEISIKKYYAFKNEYPNIKSRILFKEDLKNEFKLHI